jgi:predicted ATPase/signal transduction histidine kinase/FixJ family two-component response regulator/tRNA A-37 threonylcarbamoyl transferase component Bud32
MHTIAGYHIIAHLHESANSLVYRALREEDNFPVVLKLLKEPYPSPERIAWFKREYEVTRNLKMDGVPKVYDLQSLQNRWLMVLEDFGGESLTRLRMAGRLELSEFLQLAIAITTTLGHIHQRHIMHKDLNLANIVGNIHTQEVKIIDFGISTVLSRENPAFRNPNVLEGTLAYMSPEQTGRMNRAMDYRTDFYSLGITFYELLTGMLPFSSDDALELVHQHIARSPTPPHERKPEIPEALSAIILKLMSKNAEDRYQSAYGLKADLLHVRGVVDKVVASYEPFRPHYLEAAQQINALLGSFVPGEHDVSDRFLIPQKLYGRDNEVSRLLTAFEQVSQGATKVVMVKGETGIGKTALVQELYKPITRQRGYFISGRFDQFHRNSPYAALIQAFRSLIRHLLTEHASVIATWRDKLLHALGSNGQVIIDVIPEVELIIGEQPQVPQLEPSQSHNRFTLVFQQFIHVFTQPEHPLVLFLDDMQWADGASLSLLEQFMVAHGSPYLLLIGTYRSNDVVGTHPLVETLTAIEQAKTSISTLSLNALEVSAVTRLVAETLHCSEEQAQPLAELVVMKTGGNPFFLQEFLTSLYVDTLIDFDYITGKWRWNMSLIQSQRITDNVVDLMSKKVQRLSVPSQNVLKLAACIGMQFDLIKLAVVSQNPVSQTAHLLEQAIMEGVVVPLGETYKLMTLDVPGLIDAVTAEYAFSHNRLQQAAYSLIPLEERQEVHWRIGSLLLLDIREEQREEYIFAIVNQLNHGRALIVDQDEQQELAELNLIAGKKAKSAAAFAPAMTYLNTGIALLTTYSWQNHYAMVLELYGEAAEVAYLNGNFQRMEQLSEIVFVQATNVLDMIKVYEITIRANIAQGKQVEAVQTALDVLKELGIVFCEKPDVSDVLEGLQETRLVLAKRSFEALISLPEMTDPYKLAAMRILTSTINAAYVAMPRLMTLITFKMVQLSVNYGYTPMSAHAYASYGLILCGDIGDIDAGYRFGQLALQLLARFDARELKPRTLMVVNNFIRHWKEHARETIHPLIEAHHLGMEVGDFEFASLAIYVSSSLSFYTGSQLERLMQEMSLYEEELHRLGQLRALYMINLYRQVTANLLETSDCPSQLLGEYYNEETMLPLHSEANDKTAIYYVYFNKMLLSYLFYAFDEAVDHAAMAEQYSASAVGSYSIALLYFYDSLARLALIREQRDRRKRVISSETKSATHHLSSITRHLEKVTGNQKRLKQWAQHAPMNHLHKWYLVEAERAYVLGNDRDARDYYDRAIDLARDYGYGNEEALACELAARFYTDHKRSRIAHIYLEDAHYAYRQWGAVAKIEHLETIYAPYFSKKDDSSADKFRVTSSITETGGKLSSSLDVVSIMKASQAIFGEIVLEPLLTRLMHVFIENAGAQRGTLLLRKGEDWVIEADGIENDDMLVLQCIPLSSDIIPTTVIHYVSRMRESVVIHDARREHAFVQDVYMQKGTPQSILCMPLIYEGELIGILYLENNLATGAFTEDRVEVLNLLASQAAISIVHARLYRHMEDLVAARTAELSRTNETLQAEIAERKHIEEVLQQAKDAAEAANRAKSAFLANMSHELRTPLNAILGFAQIMQRSQSLSAEHQESVSIIHRSGEHLLSLINSVLDLSKIEAGRMELREMTFALHHMLDDLYNMFQLRAKERNLEFRFVYTPELPRYIHADGVQLRQVLTNLLSNALKFTRKGSVVLRAEVFKQAQVSSISDYKQQKVEGGEHQDGAETCFIQFIVEDTGPGIAKEELHVLFEAFSQTQTGLQSQEGTGLGLAISNKFVQLMGGEMQVQSEPGMGAIFSFVLPVKVVQKGMVVEEQHHRQVVGIKPGQPKYRMLVVDDQRDNRHLLVRLLSSLGIQVREAADGQEALEMWQSWNPHLIWMDIRMPVLDGYEATKHIKSDQQYPTPVIIALTASAFEEDRSVILASGCDDFVRKPFQEYDIFSAMHKHIGLEYVYQDEQEGQDEHSAAYPRAYPATSQPWQQEAYTELIAQMPISWIANIYRAATLGEIHMLLRLIEQVEANNTQLADWLKQLVNTFRFDAITDVCRPLLEESQHASLYTFTG